MEGATSFPLPPSRPAGATVNPRLERERTTSLPASAFAGRPSPRSPTSPSLDAGRLPPQPRPVVTGVTIPRPVTTPTSPLEQPDRTDVCCPPTPALTPLASPSLPSEAPTHHTSTSPVKASASVESLHISLPPTSPRQAAFSPPTSPTLVASPIDAAPAPPKQLRPRNFGMIRADRSKRPSRVMPAPSHPPTERDDDDDVNKGEPETRTCGPPPSDARPFKATTILASIARLFGKKVPPPSEAGPPKARTFPASFARLFVYSTVKDRFKLLLPAVLLSTIVGLIQPFMTILLGRAFQHFVDFTLAVGPSPSQADLRREAPALMHAIQWISLELGALGLFHAAMATAMHSVWFRFGSRMTKRIQELVYEGVQKREMAWFDLGMPDWKELKFESTTFELDFGKDSASSLMGRFLSQTDEIRMGTTATLANQVQYLVSILAALGIALHACWQLTLAVVTMFPVIWGTVIFSERPLLVWNRHDQDLLAQMADQVEKAVSSIPTVKAFNAESDEIRQVETVSDRVVKNWRTVSLVLGGRNGLVQFWTLMSFAIGFGFGTYLIKHDVATPGQVNNVFWACVVAMSMTQSLIPGQMAIERARAAVATLSVLIEAPPTSPHDTVPQQSKPAGVEDPFADPVGAGKRASASSSSKTLEEPVKSPVSPTVPVSPTYVPVRRKTMFGRRKSSVPIRKLRGVQPPSFSGELALQQVTFHYPSRPPPAPPALYDVTLFIPPRETTFIVGGSGSGKSTVASLLLGLYRPTFGTLDADEQVYDWIDQGWLRGRVGAVTQGTAFIIEGTVHDNVALGAVGGLGPDGKPSGRRPQDVSREEVEQACTATMLHEFVRDLPDGYDTWLSGDRGASLSGGQRQRIALARAYIRDPPVLILDEATSALDATTRLLVHDAIKLWRHNKTTVCITHDLSPIEPDDFVYVMQDGEVVQQGYRSELEYLGSGVFADLVRLQANHPVRESTVDETWEVIEPVKVTPGIAEPAPPYTGFLGTPTAPTPGIGPALPDAVALADFAARRLTSAILSVSRNASRDSDESDRDLPEPLKDEYGTDSRRESRRMDRMSTLMLSGRQATLRRAHREGALKARRAWTDDELRAVGGVAVRVGSGANSAKDARGRRRGFLGTMLIIYPQLRDKRMFIVGLLSGAVQGAMTPLFAVVLGSWLANLVSPPPGYLLRSILIIFGIATLDCVAFSAKHFLLEMSGQHWITWLRHRCFSNAIRQDLTFFDEEENSSFTIAARIVKDGYDAKDVVGQVCAQAAVMVTMTVIALTWATVIGWKLCLVGVAMAPLFVGVIAFLHRLTQRLEERNKVLREEVSARFFQTVSNMKAIRAMSVESVLEADFRAATQASYKMLAKTGPISGLSFGMSSCLVLVAEGVLFYVGAHFVSTGVYTFSEMTRVFALIVFGVSFAAHTTQFLPALAKGTCGTMDMQRLCQLSLDTKEREGKMTFPVQGEIRLDNVGFSYPSRPDVPVLDDVSLIIKPGELVGIVGASGSGKSTIASLMQRLYEPTSGRLLLDGRELSRIDVEYLRNNIGVVSQIPVLFSMSIRDNITYGSRGSWDASGVVSQEEVEAAARLANLHDFITSLPDGYDTHLGEKAGLISGGQAQRLQIARALLRDRSVLILDECTSALDPGNQAAVLDTIMAVKEGRTTVMVTHKLAAMKRCDRLLVVEHGRIVEEGTFDELVSKTGGPFSTLAKAGEWAA